MLLMLNTCQYYVTISDWVIALWNVILVNQWYLIVLLEPFKVPVKNILHNHVFD